MKEVIKTAPTVDRAIELALQELGLTREEVTAEVIDYPEKKLFFKKPAKVRVCQIEEQFSVKELFEDKPKAEKTEPAKETAVKAAAKPAKEPKEAKADESVNSDREPLQEILPRQQSEKVKSAIEFLHSVIDRFYDKPYTLTPYKTQAGCVIKISGEDMGALIGRKGETMEALSYLTGLAANRTDDSFEKISVDVADYRKKKEKDLQQAAKKAAAKVLKTGRPFGFEPMNPYDRRIIHAAVSGIEGVKSESKGEGNARRVMIYSTSPRPRYNKGYGSKKPYSRNRREKPAPQAQKTRDEKLVDESGLGIYSKIDL